MFRQRRHAATGASAPARFDRRRYPEPETRSALDLEPEELARGGRHTRLRRFHEVSER